MVIFGTPHPVLTFKPDFAFKLQIREPIPKPVTPIPITPIGELIVHVGTYNLLLNKRLTLLVAIANLRSARLVAIAFVLCQIKVHVYFETRMIMIDIFAIISLHNV